MIVKKLMTVIQVLLIMLFAACAGYVGKYFYDAHRAQRSFDEIKAESEKNAPEQVDASGNYEEKYADNGMLLQYYSLYEQNNDMTGWLKIADTPIDYPVVRGDDNEYYLHRDFHKNNRYSGIPFLDYQCTHDSLNSIIYAHNMKNGSMFATISKYDDRNYYNAHTLIDYDTLYERRKYEIMAVFRTVVGSKNEFRYHDYADIEDEERFYEYVNMARALSIYDTGVTAVYGDRLLALSTCAYHTSNERIVIVARQIQE